jgi:hypothetical protein
VARKLAAFSAFHRIMRREGGETPGPEDRPFPHAVEAAHRIRAYLSSSAVEFFL